MTVIKCNKCGKEIQESIKHLEGTDNIAGFVLIVTVDIEKDSTLDLCEQCARDVVYNALRPETQIVKELKN